MSRFFALAILVAALSAAALGAELPRSAGDAAIRALCTDEARAAYAHALVNASRYTGRGASLHAKYLCHLVALAADLSTAKKLAPAPGSIGFYHDGGKGHYLGLALKAHDPGGRFGVAAVKLVRSDLPGVLDSLGMCGTVFADGSVAGAVVSWEWGGSSAVLWIEKGDIAAIRQGRLTFNDLVARATLTDGKGKIFRIP